MKKTADVIVVGLGAHGSAAFRTLAERGIDVIGIDQYHPPHTFGSSHGDTRITRLACGEGSDYTRFAHRSLGIWRELELEFELRNKLYLKTGGLMIGAHSGQSSFHGRRDFVGKTIHNAIQSNVFHQLLSAEDIRREFPQFRVRDDEFGYYEPSAGILFPEECIRANLTAARYRGATDCTGTEVHGIWQKAGSVSVSTTLGEMSAKHCILTTGAFVREHLPPKYRGLFTITRQVLHWFSPRTNVLAFQAKNGFPIYIWERHGLYGFPGVNSGWIKMALGGKGSEISPVDLSHPISAVRHEEIDAMHTLLSDAIPDLAGTSARSLACMYTNTPDGDFVIDWHPEMDKVLVVSACSGHGFKHSAAVGELAAELVAPTVSNENPNLDAFSWDRFKKDL